MNQKFVFFQYHLNCRDFTENAGAIKRGLMQTNQNTVRGCFYLKSQQLDVTRRYFKCIWIKSLKNSYFFNITSIVWILLKMQVLLNVV